MAHSDEVDERLNTLKPGDIIVYDGRRAANTHNNNNNNNNTTTPPSSPSSSNVRLGPTFRVMQWNIERGSQMDAIVATLQACPADVYLLQELDIHCRRSRYLNVPEYLAKTLGVVVYFVCEFEELDDARRNFVNRVGPRSQGSGTPNEEKKEEELPPSLARYVHDGHPLRHFHGNAIVSAGAELVDLHVLPHTQHIDWEVEGNVIGEPRHGFRSVLRATLPTSSRTNHLLPPVFLYSLHLEIFCGALMRVAQLGDCLHDAQKLLTAATTADRRERAAAAARGGAPQPLRRPAFIIGGDLNTIAHGLVRCSPRYAKDRLRWLSLGETEASWLHRKVLSRRIGLTQSTNFVATCYRLWSDAAWVWRWLYGFDAAAMDRLRNDELCFYDPADKNASITLDNPAYHGWVKGKLDWLLLSNMIPEAPSSSSSSSSFGGIDVDALVRQGSITSPDTLRYLRTLPESSTSSSSPTPSSTMMMPTQHNKMKRIAPPRDGYVLINDRYTASDHKALWLSVRQNVGDARECYGLASGGTWTRDGISIFIFVVVRLALASLMCCSLGWCVWRWGGGGLSEMVEDAIFLRRVLGDVWVALW